MSTTDLVSLDLPAGSYWFNAGDGKGWICGLLQDRGIKQCLTFHNGQTTERIPADSALIGPLRPRVDHFADWEVTRGVYNAMPPGPEKEVIKNLLSLAEGVEELVEKVKNAPADKSGRLRK